jgi:hypothetical protein
MLAARSTASVGTARPFSARENRTRRAFGARTKSWSFISPFFQERASARPRHGSRALAHAAQRFVLHSRRSGPRTSNINRSSTIASSRQPWQADSGRRSKYGLKTSYAITCWRRSAALKHAERSVTTAGIVLGDSHRPCRCIRRHTGLSPAVPGGTIDFCTPLLNPAASGRRVGGRR